MNTCTQSPSIGFLDYIDENKLFSFITTSTFAIIWAFIYIVSLYRYFEKAKIPRISHPSVPYGNIKDVIDKDTTLFELVSKYYSKLKKKALKYGGMYLFFKPAIVIIDPELISEILQNKKSFSGVNFEEDLHETSKLMLSAEVVEEYLKNSSNDIKKEFIDCLNNNGKIQEILYAFVLDSMFVIFGLEKNEETRKLIDSLKNDMTCSSLKNLFYLVYPFFKQCTFQEFNMIIEITELKRKKNDINKKDILQSIMKIKNEQKLEILSHAFIINFIENIIFSYYSSLFCLYELASNTDIQEELIGEVRRFISGDKNINDLPYLEAVVKETLRVYPPVPLIIKRCKENYESNKFGLKLAKNNLVLIPTSAIHHDANIYTDPKKFDPDRFLEDDIEKLSTFLPFGSKVNTHEERHKGFHLSIIVMKVILVSIFSNFKVKLTNENYYMHFDSTKLNMQPGRPVPLKLEPLS